MRRFLRNPNRDLSEKVVKPAPGIREENTTPFVCVRWRHFAAWAVAQSTPTLQSQAFVVCERGYVIAASPPATSAGVIVGQTSGRASARVAGLVIVSRDKNREALVWAEVQRQLYGLTPFVESKEVGLLFGALRPEKLARLLRVWSASEAGAEGFWPVGGGSASDRATATLAALQAPNGLCRAVKRGAESSFAGRVAISQLGGEISPQTRQKLEWLGWKTLLQLRPLSRRQLEEQFGRDGAALFRLAQGAACTDNLRPIPTFQLPPEVNARISLELPASEPCEWNGALAETLLGATQQLGTRRAATLELTVQTALGPITARRILREATSDPKTLLSPLQNALETALQSLLPLSPVVHGFEICLGGLCTPATQTRLFEDERETRQNRLQAALQHLESRGEQLELFERNQSDSPFEEEWWRSVSALTQIARTKGGTPHASSLRVVAR